MGKTQILVVRFISPETKTMMLSHAKRLREETFKPKNEINTVYLNEHLMKKKNKCQEPKSSDSVKNSKFDKNDSDELYILNEFVDN